MLTYIKVKNFKSLKSIELNLKKTKEKVNNFVAIYGENGSGKTNIVDVFSLLQELIFAKSNDKITDSLTDVIEDNGILSIEKILERLSLNLNEYRTIGEEEATEIECGFKSEKGEGFYYIKFKEEVLEERMYYKIDKLRGYLYEIKAENNSILKKLNHHIFINNNYARELEEIIDQYWGKYTFLSLIFSEIVSKNGKYIENGISINLFDAMNELLLMAVHVNKRRSRTIPDRFSMKKKLGDIQEGRIDKDRIDEIKKYEDILNVFFTQAYADIKAVKYNIKNDDNKIDYELFFEKMIGGKLKSISYKLESEGTRKILEQFDTLAGALVGETVIIDEIDNGVHDLLMKNIIMSVKDEITGQLIITTHNTLLLEVLPKENIYILSVDYMGNKMIHAIRDYDNVKLQKNHNARDLYLKGVFGGIPMCDYIDFEEIRYAFGEQEDDE